MSGLKDFNEWYKNHWDKILAEATTPPTNIVEPHYVPKANSPFGQIQRQAMNAYNWATGKGTIDWSAKERANQLAQRQHNQAQTFGDSDDPNVRNQKMQGLAKAFQNHLHQLSQGASPQTSNIINKAADEFAGMLTQGRPLLPQPVSEMIYAVTKDPGISDDLKRRAWQNHEVLLGELLRVFHNNPSFWYDTKATDKFSQFPPGSTYDANTWTSAMNRFKQNIDDERTVNTVNVKDELVKRGIRPGMLSRGDLNNLMDDIVKNAKSKGQTVNMDDADRREIVSWALSGEVDLYNALTGYLGKSNVPSITWDELTDMITDVISDVKSTGGRVTLKNPYAILAMVNNLPNDPDVLNRTAAELQDFVNSGNEEE